MPCPAVGITVRNPDGSEEEKSLEEAIEEAEEAQSEDPPEEWQWTDYETEEVEIDGVTIDRFTSVTFEKPTGKKIKLILPPASELE